MNQQTERLGSFVRLLAATVLICSALYAGTSVRAKDAVGCCGNSSCSVLDGNLIVCSPGQSPLCHPNFPTCCLSAGNLCCGEEFGCSEGE